MILDLQQVNSEDFDKCMNTYFFMYPEGHDPVKLVLIQLCEKSNAHIYSFTLSFLASTDTVFPQGIFKMSHEVLGEMNLFLVPYNKDAKGVHYESVFSRLRN